MKTRRVFLADDHKILRESLKHYLRQEAIVDVVGVADNGLDAYKEIIHLKPEIAILDISMPQLNGLDLCKKLKVEMPELKVIILTMHKSEEMLYKALSSGVNGYVLKDNALEDLIEAIKTVIAGKIFISVDLLQMVVGGFVNNRKDSTEQLSIREREILQMLAEGRGNKEIAVALHLSVKTVETHRANIMKKLGLRNIADLVLYAVRNHLIEA
ncbi:MAG: NarL family two component response regulator [Fusobacteria bacterium]|nr:MAG: NarL family two component response regulator [Fusobacteriota bacterium]KAF0230225.1 MAG: NarL family two component response [Fusobacteriota bacterium]